MKHLQLFESFRTDIIKSIKDAKKIYKSSVNDYKERYKSELNDCVSDLEDNYNIHSKNEDIDSDSKLTYFEYVIYVELERMDDFLEDILSTGSKVLNHLDSEISVQFYYLKPRNNADDDVDIGDVATNKMSNLEHFIKAARTQFRDEIQKSDLWDIVSDKPKKSPSYGDINLEPKDDMSHPFMIYAEIYVGG
jgi:hypothetical protein